MRKLFVVSLVALVVAALTPAAHTAAVKPMLVRVHTHSDQQIAYLFDNFDETHNHDGHEIELLLWPGDAAELTEAGFDYEVVVEDLWERDLEQGTAAPAPVEVPGPDREDYRRLPDYNREMKQLAKKNDGLVSLLKMPRKSLEGRAIYGLEIAAKVGRRDGRPVFYVDGVHHAREWPASELTMIYAHYLTSRYGKDRHVTRLLRKARVILVPIVNVDGFDYSRESVLSVTQPARDRTTLMAAANGFEGYWRKNRRSLTGVTVPAAQKNPDSYGVDPNRNYAYLWGDQQGGSGDEIYSQTYRGETPFSEPETKNVRDIIMGHGVTGVITNHTYQSTVLRTGGGEAPDDDALERIGERMAKVMGYENNESVGYPTTGTTDDWAYAATGPFGFTIEHGTIGFHPRYDLGVGEPAKKVMKAFMIGLEMAADTRYHSVISGRVLQDGKPVQARLTLGKTFKTPLSPGNPLGKKSVTERFSATISTGRDGGFTWHVGPSTRPYVKGAESYGLVIETSDGSVFRRIHVDRGEHLRLGTIDL